MTKVIDLPCITTLDIPVDKILDRAKDAGMTHVVVIGWRGDGKLYFASSTADGGEVIWLMEKAKMELLEV